MRTHADPAAGAAQQAAGGRAETPGRTWQGAWQLPEQWGQQRASWGPGCGEAVGQLWGGPAREGEGGKKEGYGLQGCRVWETLAPRRAAVPLA